MIGPDNQQSNIAQQAKIGQFGPEVDTAEFAASFRRDGVAIFDRLWQPSRIEEFREQLLAREPSLFDAASFDPAGSLRVSEGRYVVPLEIGQEPACLDLLLHKSLIAAFAATLGDDWVFDAVGVIVSFPGAPQQKAHRDGPPLYGKLGIDKILPPYALTLAIPLRPMDAAWGSTGFWPGSQMFTGDALDEAMVVPEIALGACVLWNYLIRHCGLANRMDQARPLLYVTACRYFWVDHKNFRPTDNNKLMISSQLLASLPDNHRARFHRAVVT